MPEVEALGPPRPCAGAPREDPLEARSAAASCLRLAASSRASRRPWLRRSSDAPRADLPAAPFDIGAFFGESSVIRRIEPFGLRLPTLPFAADDLARFGIR